MLNVTLVFGLHKSKEKCVFGSGKYIFVLVGKVEVVGECTGENAYLDNDMCGITSTWCFRTLRYRTPCI